MGRTDRNMGWVGGIHAVTAFAARPPTQGPLFLPDDKNSLRCTAMEIIDSQQVVERLEYRTLIEALRSAFGDRGVHTAQSRLETGSSDDSKVLLLKSAWGKDVTVAKVLTLNESNRQAGIPFVQGLVAIFDKSTGTPLGVVDGKEITCRRTAAASALAADYLAVSHAEVLTVIGTGALAPYMALAHAVTRPLRQINVFGRNADKAETTAATIRKSLPEIRVRAVSDLPEAVRSAHIVCTVTSSKTPVLHGAWVSDGTHLDLVGGFTPDAREADDQAIARARVYLDDRETALEEAGDIVMPIAGGTIATDDIVGDLWGLCRGQVAGRMTDKEVTVFKSVGTALEDLVAAKLIVAPGSPT